MPRTTRDLHKTDPFARDSRSSRQAEGPHPPPATGSGRGTCCTPRSPSRTTPAHPCWRRTRWCPGPACRRPPAGPRSVRCPLVCWHQSSRTSRRSRRRRTRCLLNEVRFKGCNVIRYVWAPVLEYQCLWWSVILSEPVVSLCRLNLIPLLVTVCYTI